MQGLETAPFCSIIPLLRGASLVLILFLSAMTSPAIVWLFKDDQGYEDYAQSEEERDELVMIYETAGSNYSIIELLGDEE
jgi:hypothetical protein